MRSKQLALAAILFAVLALNLETTLVNNALPALVRELHASTSQLQWVVDAFNLTFAAFLLTAGSIADRFGRKRALLLGLFVFGLSAVLGGAMSNPTALIVLRACMGVGAAFAFPPTLSILTNIFVERKERAAVIGMWGAVTGVAIAMGPLVGGWLLEHFSWRSTFVVMGPIALLAMSAVALSVPDSKNPTPSRLDLPGLATAALGALALVYTIIEAPTWGWFSAKSIGGFALGAFLIAVFILQERASSHPMLDVRVFRNPRFSAASSSVAISFFALFGFTFLIVQYFQFIKGYSPLSTGVRILPVAMSFAAGSVIGTQAAVKLGTKTVVSIGFLCLIAFYGWIALVATPHMSYGIIAMQMVVGGFGMATVSAPATESIMGAVSNYEASVGSAVNDTTRLLGGTLGVAVLGSIYASSYVRGVGQRLTGHLTPLLVHTVKSSVGAGLAVGRHAAGPFITNVVTSSFMHALRVTLASTVVVVVIGLIVSIVFIPNQPPALAGQSKQDNETSR